MQLKNDNMNKARVYFKPKSNIPAFLIKTYDILENPVHSDIISWNKDGTAFIVKNVNEFSEKILPKYFKHNNFSSFVRQLNMYDFHKSKQDNKENEFKHKLFKRGHKHLLADIKRKGSENHQFPEEQVTGPVRTAEINKVKKNTNILNEELYSVKNQQGELEKLSKVIYSQNSQLLNENKLLWEELNKNKEKYDKKIDKLMMFIYSMMHQQPGNEAIGYAAQKMLPASESTDAMKPNILGNPEQGTSSPHSQQKSTSPVTPEKKGDDKIPKATGFFQEKKPETKFDNITVMDQALNKPKSPANFGTPTLSGVSTLPNTPNMVPMMGMPNLSNMQGAPLMPGMMPIGFPIMTNGSMPMMHNTYSAQPYFQDNSGLSPNSNMNAASTSGNFFRRENPKINRPVPSMDNNEAREFKENPVKILKKEPEAGYQVQNSLQVNNFPSFSGLDDPMKLEEWPFQLNLSRGPSYNAAGDLNLSRFNSYTNIPRVPNSLEPNFSQSKNYLLHLY